MEQPFQLSLDLGAGFLQRKPRVSTEIPCEIHRHLQTTNAMLRGHRMCQWSESVLQCPGFVQPSVNEKSVDLHAFPWDHIGGGQDSTYRPDAEGREEDRCRTREDRKILLQSCE